MIINYGKPRTSRASKPHPTKLYTMVCLSGRAKFGTLYFYTELWDFAPLINYGNLFKFTPKITKMASPLFLYRFSFCLFYLIGLGGASKLIHKFSTFINYANLCKFIQNKMFRTSFLNRFWFGLLYLIELIGGFKICTQNSTIVPHEICDMWCCEMPDELYVIDVLVWVIQDEK